MEREKRISNRKKKIKNQMTIVAVLCLAIGLIVGILIGSILGGSKKNMENKNNKVQSEVQNEIIDENIKSYKIKTSYCDLHFPENWKKQIEVKIVEDDVYTVEFYGLVDDKDSVHLFDVSFGGKENGIGRLKIEKEEVNVSIKFADIDFNEEWSQDEQDQIYGMQEDANYLMDMLTKEKNFTPNN